jgi:hypothetical protein
MGLPGDDAGEPVRPAQRELQPDVAAERRAHEDRVLQVQCVTQGDDEVRVVVGRQFVLLGPPLGVLRRVRLAVPGQVVGDDAVAGGDLLVLEQPAPLVVVASRGVLALQRLSGAILEVEDLVQQSVDVDVMSGDG